MQNLNLPVELTVQNEKGRWILILGALLAGTAVALGAFGAHGLKSILSESALTVFEKGVRYQMYHGLALFATGVLLHALPAQMNRSIPFLLIGALFLAIGVLLFSGTLYIFTLAGLRWVLMITPVGGVSFLIGWMLMVIAFFQKSRSS